MSDSVAHEPITQKFGHPPCWPSPRLGESPAISSRASSLGLSAGKLLPLRLQLLPTKQLPEGSRKLPMKGWPWWVTPLRG